MRDVREGFACHLACVDPPLTPAYTPPPSDPCDAAANNSQPCFLRIEVNGAMQPDPEETAYGLGIVTLSPMRASPPWGSRAVVATTWSMFFRPVHRRRYREALADLPTWQIEPD